MDVSVIIPNYNGGYLLPDLFNNLLGSLSDEITTEIIFLDDASTDNSLTIAEKYKKHISVIAKKKNTGFIASVNEGALRARGRFLFLLNTDVIVNKDTLPKLYEFINVDYKYVLAVSPSILSEDGDVYSPNICFPMYQNGFFRLGKISNVHQICTPHRTLFVSGGSGLFNRRLFLQLGGFHSIFTPMYSEDVDLGWRGWNNGLGSYYFPDCYVIHKSDGVVRKYFNKKKIMRLKIRNRILLMWCNSCFSDIYAYHFLNFPQLFRSKYPKPTVALALMRAIIRLPSVIYRRKYQSDFMCAEGLQLKILSQE